MEQTRSGIAVASVAPALPARQASMPVPGTWIISRTQDLLWFQAPVLVGVALMAAFLWLPPLARHNYGATHPAVWLLLFWGVLFDGTHVMATYARTYFAGDAHSKAALPGSASFAWLLLGPAVAILDYGLCEPHPSLLGSAGWLFDGFLAAAYVWAYYHLVRQHYGFLSLYQRKERSVPSLASPDAMALWVGTAYPFLRFTLSDAYRDSGLPVPIPEAWIAISRCVLDGAALIAAGVIAVWMIRRARLDHVKPGPKHVFLAIVVAFSNLAFAVLDNLLVITAVLTIFHNLQYHRIVWQYERGRQRVPMGSIAIYAAAGLAFGIAWYTPRVLGVALAEDDLWRNVLIGACWGVAFHHYFIDARIWRLRREPAVAAALDRGAA
jgi:hypothetical protein